MSIEQFDKLLENYLRAEMCLRDIQHWDADDDAIPGAKARIDHEGAALRSYVESLEAEKERLALILREVELVIDSEAYQLGLREADGPSYLPDLHPADKLEKHILRAYRSAGLRTTEEK